MTLALSPAFGAGGAEPYANALRRDDDALFLRNASAESPTQRRLDLAGWTADADPVDRTLIEQVVGPMLDVGCGPGRLVRAAEAQGIPSLGIDVSAAAVETARGLGGTFSQQTVFDRVRDEGTWRTALLIDGNIGIGGDIPALLTRCAEIIAPDGIVVVELDTDPAHEQRYEAEIVDGSGASSARFPWAEVGRDALSAMLHETPLEITRSWEIGGRSFSALARR